jgi:hypothetical protein
MDAKSMEYERISDYISFCKDIKKMLKKQIFRANI